MSPVCSDSGNATGDGRPAWDAYFMTIAELVSSRSTCLRHKVGSVVVKERRILCSGYNGAPSKTPHCRETGCLREQHHVPSGERHELCRGVHAEQNAIIQAAFHGVRVAGASLYTTTRPCAICAKMLINAGIRKVYFRTEYNDPLALEMLDQAGVALIRIK